MTTPRMDFERRLLPWLLAGAFVASLSAVAVGERLADRDDPETAPLVVVLRLS